MLEITYNAKKTSQFFLQKYPPYFLGDPTTIGFLPGFLPRHMTEHWLKFQNGPARRSRVIARKQLKYYQIRQFCPLGPPGSAGGRIQNWKKTPAIGAFDSRNLPAKFLRDQPNSFWELMTEEKKRNTNSKTRKAFHAKCLNYM